MIIFKKNFSLLLLVSMVFSTCSAGTPTDVQVEDYSTGQTRLSAIVLNEATGMRASKPRYAATNASLAADLNVTKITEFFNCKTLVGKTFLQEALQHPFDTHDINSVLAQRQRAIKALVDNPDLKRKIDRLLDEAQKEEQEVIKLMSDFFIGKTCPELKQLEDLKKQVGPTLYAFYDGIFRNPISRSALFAINVLGLGITIHGGYTIGRHISEALQHNKYSGKAVLAATGVIAYFSLITGIQAYAINRDYSTASEKRLKIHALANLTKLARSIEHISAKHSITMQYKMSNIDSAEGLELLSKLKSERYAKHGTKLFLPPFVHLFLYKIYDHEKHLAQIFASIAELDAYNAIATKIIASRSQENKICFATFARDVQPVARSHGMWNILVENPVLNSIDEQKSVILTGPNAGGKTTTIRSILQNIVLAQTFGVAAATSCECSLFDVIHSYLNISDDLMNGLSLFASEVKRAQTILEQIKNLKPGQKYFFALDELFTGTVTADGEVCAYNFVNKLSQFADVQFIYATHFEKLKELASANSFCANYKVDAPTKNEFGKLVYPFTLSQGASDSRVAIDIAQAANLF